MNNESKPKVVYRYSARVVVSILILFLLAIPLVSVLTVCGNSSSFSKNNSSESKAENSNSLSNIVETKKPIAINDSIVEESNNDTGARIIYNFYKFWDKYEENEINFILNSEAYDSEEYENAKASLDHLHSFQSNISNYDITDGTQPNSNQAVKAIKPTTDWIFNAHSTVFGTEQNSEKIYMIQTLIQNTASKMHSAMCISVMCNVSYTDAVILLNNSIDKVTYNENTLCTFNNIVFVFSTTGLNNDIPTLSLYAVTEDGLNNLGKTKDIFYLSIDGSEQPSENNTSTIEDETSLSSKNSTLNDSKYIIPDSDSRLLDKADLENFETNELLLARNKIYARHGKKFKNAYIQEYFYSQNWYKGTIESDDFSENMLKEIEKDNIQFISEYENGGNARQVSFNNFSIAVPYNWIYEDKGDYITFHEKYNYENGWSGLLLTISISETNPNDIVSNEYIKLGLKDGLYYVADNPNDIEYNYQDETATEKYELAQDSKQFVFDTFEFI